jgi:hypothetical protein
MSCSQQLAEFRMTSWLVSFCGMPSTVDALLRDAGLRWVGAVRWRERPPLGEPGVYLVARAKDPAALPANLAAPLSPAALEQLLARCPVTVDGVLAGPHRLAARLAAFWLPDESVIYIGKAGGSVADRVGAYYHTPVGAVRGPHKGGWFIKTLAILDTLWVHVAPADHPEQAEQRLIEAFCAGVSSATRAALHDPEHPLPFANLQRRPGVGKRHGLGGYRRVQPRPAPRCPDCAHGDRVLPIVYGSPAAALVEAFERGEVQLGGSTEMPQQWCCGRCGLQWPDAWNPRERSR